MADEDHATGLSPTVVQVIDRFLTALRDDDGIDQDSVGKLEKLLREGSVPKSEDINAALFPPPPDDEP